MSNFLYIKFSDNMEYKIPVEILAKFRADYFAIEVDGFTSDSPEWQVEYKYALREEDELISFAFNNLNWEDVAPHAQFVSHAPIYADYIKEWSNVNYIIRSDK